MSWLFGLNKGNQGGLEVPQVPVLGDGDGGDKDAGAGDKEGHRSAPYSFDSSALERAAKAAKELEKSKFATQAFELSKMQENTRMQEQMTKMKEYEAHMEQLKIEQKRVDGEQKRKYMEEEAKIAKHKAEYQDQLARRRYEDQLVQQQRMQEENLKKQEESLAKQEAMRQATIKREIEARAEADAKRIESEVKAKAKMERENQDLYLEQIRLKAKEDRSKALESIQTAGSVLGAGAEAFLADWAKVTAAAAGFSMLALGFYTAKRSTGVLANYIEARLGKPSLVRDTSRFSLFEAFKHPIDMAKKFSKKPQDALSGVVLEPKLETSLRDVVLVTKNQMLNGGLFRNLLFHGPPGTGKTLFAKKLAMTTGMDYAILTGGDIAPMGGEGVTAVHKLFDWAYTSRKGMILFVDEAEAFLRKRSSEKISEDMRSTLSAFLYRTGDPSNKFMLILATNTPEQLDWAVNDRLDDIVEFPLPGYEERERLVRLYFDKYVLQLASETTKGRRIKVEDMDYSALCSEIAKKVAGMSGREISKLGVSWQASGYASEDGVLTKAMIMDKVDGAVKSHMHRVHWQSEEEIRKNKDMSYKSNPSLRESGQKDEDSTNYKQ